MIDIVKEAIRPKQYRNPLYIGKLRNIQCICGSGNKIKNCHGQSYAISASEAREINQFIKDHQDKMNQEKHGNI